MLRTIAPVVSFSGSSNNNNKNSKQPIHFVQKWFVQITKAMLWFCLPWKRRRCQRIKITTKLRMIRKIKLFFQRKTEIKSKWLNMRSFGAAEREREREAREPGARALDLHSKRITARHNPWITMQWMRTTCRNMTLICIAPAITFIQISKPTERTRHNEWLFCALVLFFRPFQPNAISFDFI